MSETVQQLKRRVEELEQLVTYTNEDVNTIIEISWQLRYADTELASRLSRQALLHSQINDNQRGEAYAQRNLGLCEFYKGFNQTAKHHLETSRKMFLNLSESEDAGLASVLNGLGAIHQATDEYEKALEYCFAALDHYEKTKNPFNTAIVRNNLGVVYSRLGNYATALDNYCDALAFAVTSKSKLPQAWLYIGLGDILCHLSQTDTAVEYLQQSVSLLRSHELNRHESISLSNLGSAYHRRREYQKALETYLQSLSIAEEQGQTEIIAEVNGRIGAVHLETGNLIAAAENLWNGLSYAEKLSTRFYKCEILFNLGSVCSQLKDFREAENLFSEALELSGKLNLKDITGKTHLALSKLFETQGEIQKALQHYQQFHHTWQETYGTSVILTNQKWLSKLNLSNEQLSSKLELKAESKSSDVSALPKRKLEQVLVFIHNHLERNLSIREMAEVVGLNEDYFTRCFKKATGKTPYQLLLEERIKRAVFFLQTTGMPIVDIALQCGFSSQSHFTTHFKHITGQTPRQVRQSSLNKT